MIDDDDLEEFLQSLRVPLYSDSQQEINSLSEEVDRLNDTSLLDEMSEIDKDIKDKVLKSILLNYNNSILKKGSPIYNLSEKDRFYLKNLYIVYYTEIYLDEDGQFIYDPRRPIERIKSRR